MAEVLDCKSIHLKNLIAEGLPNPEDFFIRESKVSTKVGEDGILLQVVCMSPDPYMRGRIKPDGPFKAGDVLMGYVVGKVLKSGNTIFAAGDLFGGILPFSTIQNIPGWRLARMQVWNLRGVVDSEGELSKGMGSLGMPGSTAYGGLFHILRPKEGETLLVNACCGAVGSLVGQLAKKVFNCTVIGSCGGPEKCAVAVEKFGFNHVIDYKKFSTKETFGEELKRLAPGGIDMYFENVGGMQFEAVMDGGLKEGGRVAVCGTISGYNDKTTPLVSFNPARMIYTHQRIEGFVCSPWLHGDFSAEFFRDMPKHIKQHRIVCEETVFEGIEAWPQAFLSLFLGQNTGKVVLRV